MSFGFDTELRAAKQTEEPPSRGSSVLARAPARYVFRRCRWFQRTVPAMICAKDRKAPAPSPRSPLGAAHSLKTPHRGVFNFITQRATLVGLITPENRMQSPSLTKRKAPTRGAFLLVAEAGFEPHDLRVMSPTSYQAAPLRDRNLSSKGLYRIPRECSFVKHYFQICSVT